MDRRWKTIADGSGVEVEVEGVDFRMEIGAEMEVEVRGKVKMLEVQTEDMWTVVRVEVA